MLELAAPNWRYNPWRQPLRIRVEQVRLEISRWYNGAWVWTEGRAQIGEAPAQYRHVLVSTRAISHDCQDPKYRPPKRYTINPADLRPGALVRVGKRSAGSIGKTFVMRIASIGEQQPDGRIPLTGYRLTLAGRVVQHVTISAPLDDLFSPDIT